MKMLLYKSLGALKDHGRGGLSLRTLTPFVVRGCSQKEGAGIYLDNLIFISNLHTMGPILAEGGVKVNGAPHTEGSLITKEASFSGDSVLPATEESGVSITVSDVSPKPLSAKDMMIKPSSLGSGSSNTQKASEPVGNVKIKSGALNSVNGIGHGMEGGSSVGLGLQIDLKNISKHMINRDLIGEDVLMNFDSKVYNYISFIKLVRVIVPKYLFKELTSNLRRILINMGISKVNVELIVQQEIIKDHNISIVSKEGLWNLIDTEDKYKDLEVTFYTLLNYASKRKIILNNDLLDKLFILIINVKDVKIQDLDALINNIIKELNGKFNDYAINTQYVSVSSRKHPNREREASHNKYEKLFNDGLDYAINDIKNSLIKWVSDETNIVIGSVDSESKLIENIITNINESIAKLLFKLNPSKIVLNKNSIKSKVNKITNVNIKEFISDQSRDIEAFNTVLNYINSVKSLDDQINKISSIDTPLIQTIKTIIDSDLSNYDKQVEIEAGLIEYELDYFNKHNVNSY